MFPAPTDLEEFPLQAIPEHPRPTGTADWPERVYEHLRKAGVRQVSFVPDAGHARLINLFGADAGVRSITLTTEEEGIAVAAGAWLGGQRSVMLLQSSGVGNCVNMLSLAANCRFPLLMMVTMRGEWGEFNPWQVPMGRATEDVLKLMGVHTIRVDSQLDIDDAMASATLLAFDSDMMVAVILSQRLLGSKKWIE
jgi:sulfopyruvate decarboxylase alpha subunit